MRNTALNYSGFGGYPIASIYPDLGDMMGQTMATVPDLEEQEHLSAQKPDQQAQPPVRKGARTQLWVTLAIIAGLIFAFSRG